MWVHPQRRNDAAWPEGAAKEGLSLYISFDTSYKGKHNHRHLTGQRDNTSRREGIHNQCTIVGVNGSAQGIHKSQDISSSRSFDGDRSTIHHLLQGTRIFIFMSLVIHLLETGKQ